MLGLLLFCAVLSGCGSKNKAQAEEEEYSTPERPEDNHNTIIELNKFHVTESVQMNGHTYDYTIDRIPLDSVIITDEEGYKTRDNNIELTILQDGAPFFQRRFSRSAFHIHVDENYYHQCILLGMNFDRITEYGLRFVASIGKGSDSEDYKPYSVTVGADGSTNITEHDLYDADEVSRFEDEGV